MDNTRKCKTQNYKMSRRKHKIKSIETWVWYLNFRYNTKSMIKEKVD